MAQIIQTLANVIGFTDGFSVNIFIETLIDTISFTESFTHNITLEKFSDTIHLADDLRSTINTALLQDDLLLTDDFIKPNKYTFTDVLFFDEFYNPATYNDTLILTDQYTSSSQTTLYNDELIVAMKDEFRGIFNVVKVIKQNLKLNNFFTGIHITSGKDKAPILGPCD